MQSESIQHSPIAAMRGEVEMLLDMIRKDRLVRRFAGLVLAGCVAMIVLHVLGYFVARSGTLGQMLWNNFRLTAEGNFSAQYGYGLLFLSAMLFAATWLATGSRAAIFWAAVFGFLWVDDSLQYHEKLGQKLVPALGLEPAFGLRGQDMGEMLAWAFAGVLLLLILVQVVRKRRAGDLGLLVAGMACFLGLAVFGAFVDMLDSIFHENHGAKLALLEDGGELLVMGVIASLAFGTMRVAERYFD